MQMDQIKGLGVSIVVLISVCNFLAVIAVLMRLWARRIMKRKLVLNDWAAVVAMVCYRDSTIRKRGLTIRSFSASASPSSFS